MAPDVALSVGEERVRRTPASGIDRFRSSLEIIRDRPTTREEPNFDQVIPSLHAVETTAVRVERRAEAVGCRGLHTTADVVRCDDIADVGYGHTGLGTACRHVAVRVGVQRRLVRSLAIDTFDPNRKHVIAAPALSRDHLLLGPIQPGDEADAWLLQSRSYSRHPQQALTMSTSPELGQPFSVVSHAAGHVPQPSGMCLISKLSLPT